MEKGNVWLVVPFTVFFPVCVSVTLFYVQLTQALSLYGSVHKQKGEGKEREKGNAWLVVPFTVPSVSVSLYLSYSNLTKAFSPYGSVQSVFSSLYLFVSSSVSLKAYASVLSLWFCSLCVFFLSLSF
jgi:hypothetical protein